MGNNAPVPINDSSRCKTCGQVISSDCVAWAGPAIDGITICKGASITDVIMSIGTGCCGGGNTGTDNPCAANGWVDFSSSIPTSGTGSSSSYAALGFQSFFGESTFPSIVNDPPQYKVTKEGNIKLRGVLNFEFDVSAPIGYLIMNMGTIPPACFPTAMTNSQVVLTEVDQRQVQKLANFMKAYAVLNPNGTLQLLITFDFMLSPYAYRYAVSLGGVEFNIT